MHKKATITDFTVALSQRKTTLPTTTFNQLLEQVQQGYNISQACKKISVERRHLYRVLTPTQKAELKRTKVANASGVHYMFRGDADFPTIHQSKHDAQYLRETLRMDDNDD